MKGGDRSVVLDLYLLQIVVNVVAGAITAAGAAAILISLALVFRSYYLGALKRQEMPSFQYTRTKIGRGLVLALELFIGADLLRTVFRPSLEELIVLSVIVVLRTIISLTLDYELRH